jgi:hypothetical protein
MLRGCPQCRQSHSQCAASSSRPSPEKVTPSSVLFFFRPKREVIFFYFDDATRRDEGTCMPTGTGRAHENPNAQSRVSVWDRSDPRLFVIVKRKLLDPAPSTTITTTNTNTTTPPHHPPTLLWLCLLGYSAVRTKFPVLRFLNDMNPPRNFFCHCWDASWCWTPFESRTQIIVVFMCYVACRGREGFILIRRKHDKDLPRNTIPSNASRSQ